jgi:hypothetical protein
VTQAEVDQAIDDIEKEIKAVKNQTDFLRLGTTNLIIAGDASFDFVGQRHSPSTFSAGIAPLILYKLSDRLLIEGAADIGISTDTDNNSSTSFDLTIANATYLLNDYISVGAGLFVVPFGVFHNHYDPPWINKLPDEPLPFGDNGIAPSSEVGVFVQGAVPVPFGHKVTYAIYLTNGPNLVTDNADDHVPGTLNFDDFTDLNNNKAIGGRISYLPWRWMEVGYSIMSAQVDPPGFQSVNAVLQAVDFEYKRVHECIGGMIDFRAEWVWSDVGEATYHPAGMAPLRFDNQRNGGYAQLSYRPTQTSIKVLRNIEPVVRYDRLEVPTSAPGGGWEQRWTFGLDYWVQPNVVLKIAYQLDDRQVGDDLDALMIELGIGL